MTRVGYIDRDHAGRPGANKYPGQHRRHHGFGFIAGADPARQHGQEAHYHAGQAADREPQLQAMRQVTALPEAGLGQPFQVDMLLGNHMHVAFRDPCQQEFVVDGTGQLRLGQDKIQASLHSRPPFRQEPGMMEKPWIPLKYRPEFHPAQWESFSLTVHCGYLLHQAPGKDGHSAPCGSYGLAGALGLPGTIQLIRCSDSCSGWIYSSETTLPRTEIPARCTESILPLTRGCHSGKGRPSDSSR